MSEDPNINEPSGPAPGNEVPDEERFLSTEKKYPTKEARQKVLEEVKKKAELPHVPPFYPEQKPKADWQPVPEPPTKEVPPLKKQSYIQQNTPWVGRVLERNRAEVAQRTQIPPAPAVETQVAPPPPPETPKVGLVQRFANLFRRQPR